MLIPVVYFNGQQDMVKDHNLELLIEAGQIFKFKRCNGWVEVASGDLRKPKRGAYFGRERRESVLAELMAK